MRPITRFGSLGSAASAWATARHSTYSLLACLLVDQYCGFRGIPSWWKDLLFARAIAWLCDETLEEPAHGRENECEEAERERDVDDEASEDAFGAHVGA